jgi:hypothetical protein
LIAFLYNSLRDPSRHTETKIVDEMLTGTIVDWKKDIKKLNLNESKS